MKTIDQLTPEELRVECGESSGWKYDCRCFHATERADHFWEGPDGETTLGLPDFGEDANAALTLAHALADIEGFEGIYTRMTKGDVEIEVRFFTSSFEATSPTFPLALCRAYLAVIRATQPHNEH